MKKLLLSLIAAAGAWTSAGAQAALEGYELHSSNATTQLPLTSDKISSNKYSHTDTNGVEFGLSSKSLSYSDKDIIVYVFDKDGLISGGSKENGNVTFSWKKTGNYYVTVTNVAVKTRAYLACDCTVDIDGQNVTAVNYGGAFQTDNSSKQNKSVSWTLNKTSQLSDGNSNGSLTLNYKKDGRSGTYPEVGNTYIGSFNVNYTISYYTLDFTKANNLMSQAQPLYDGLSEDTKGSNAGVALHNAMEDITAFKSDNDNDNPVDITGPLRGNLTTLENNLDAAIKAFVKLDFTNANNLMSQADALYNGLSEESKSSAAGQELLNSKNTAATFKAAHENENLDKESSLFAELTNKENAIQAAINAFTCNLADTDEQYTVNNKTVTNITLTRAIKAGTWNTLCLPFDMEIPAGWTVKELSGVTYNSVADSYDAKFSTAASIVAGKPYIVKADAAVSEITRNDAAGFKLAAVPTPVEVSDNGGTLYFGGIFVPMDLAGCYFISGGKFYYAAPDKGNTTKAYRALFTVVGGTSSAKLIYTVDGDEVTLIDAPELVPANDAPIFDLQGRRVNAPVSGKLYVKNGKKFVQQ